MNQAKVLFKRIRTPVTIMMVPHGQSKPIRAQVSVLVLLICFFLCLTGAVYLVNVSVSAVEYRRMAAQLASYSATYQEAKENISYLLHARNELSNLLGLKSKIAILESGEIEYSGSFDMKALKEQLDKTVQSVAEIREYILNQKDIYRATPVGWPVEGRITSKYGTREHPVYEERRLHSGLDISVPPGTEVKATADGIVVHSGINGTGGNVVIVEHGYGFRTAYAHNSKSLVNVSQKVKRGDTIALSGSSGISTGPHVHYEVWKNGRHVNPADYLEKKDTHVGQEISGS